MPHKLSVSLSIPRYRVQARINTSLFIPIPHSHTLYYGYLFLYFIFTEESTKREKWPPQAAVRCEKPQLPLSAVKQGGRHRNDDEIYLQYRGA